MENTITTTKNNDKTNNLHNNINTDNDNKKNSNINDYECSICLEVAKEPVVTKCGHLYCWSCIYFWNENKKTCPNCNSNINNITDFIPIYNKNQTSSNTDRFKIPNRPKGSYSKKKNDSSNDSRQNSNFNFSFFGGIPFFPVFGFSFNNMGNYSFNNVFSSFNTRSLNYFNNFSSNRNVNNAVKHLVILLYMLIIYYIFF